MFKKIFEKLGVVRVLLLASFVVGLLFFGSYVFSVSADTKTAGPLSISYDGDRLFEELNVYPGFEKTKTISVKNNGAVAHSFAIAVSGISGDLADVIMIMPKISGVSLWSKAMSLSELASLSNGSQTVIDSILPGETKAVGLTASMDSWAGNDYQGKSTSIFSFIVGDQEPEPTVSILAPPGGGGVAGAGITGTAGETLGVSTSPSVSPSPSPSPSGAVSGEKNEGQGTQIKVTNYRFLYWLIPILVILLILFLLWWWWRRRAEDEEEL